MDHRSQVPTALHVDLLLWPGLRPHVTGCLARLVQGRGASRLSGALGPSIYRTHPPQPVCIEVCGCGQLRQRWLTYACSCSRDPLSVTYELWLYRRRGYRLFNI